MQPTSPPIPVSGPKSFSRNFLSDVVIDYGPRDVLSRLFLKADTQLREQGVNVSFVPFDELVDLNRRNADSWRPILPIFEPSISGLEEENGFAVVGRNSSNDVVYAHACRLYTLTRCTLKDEIESLRLFYSDPEHSRQPGEAMTVTAPAAASTTGRVVFIGAVWYRPDVRKKGLMQMTAPLVRALAYTRWQSDFAFSFMAQDLVNASTAVKARFPHVEWDVSMIKTPVYRDGTLRAALVWTNAEEQLRHFQEYSFSARPQIDLIVEKRAAQQNG